MRRVMLVLVLAAAPALAAPRDAKWFARDFTEAAHLQELGRKLEAREYFALLAWRLKRFEPETQYRNAERLTARLLELGDAKSADLVQQTVIATTIIQTTRSRWLLDDLPRAPRARGLELCRMALAQPEGSTERRVLMKGVLDALARVSAPDALVQHRLGLAHLEVGDRGQAVRLFRAAVAADPTSPGPRLALGRLYLAENRAAEALALLERVLERGLEAEGVGLVARAIAQLDASGKRDAARVAAAAWATKGTEPAVMSPLWSVRGRLAERDGDTWTALVSFAGAAAAPDRGDEVIGSVARVARAHAAKGGSERRAALGELARCAAPDPATPPKLLQLAGELALREGDRALAIRYYGAGFASKERPTFEPLLTELRQSARAAGKHHEAMQVDMVIGPPKIDEHDKGYVVVELGEERCAVDVKTGAPAGAAPSKQLADFAKVIGGVMKEYPPELAQKLRLFKFALADAAPPKTGRGWMGLTDPENKTIHVNLKTAVTDPDHWRVALHHEIFHLIDHQDDGEVTPDHRWRKLNRTEFTYSYNKDVPCDPISPPGGVEVPGFVNSYATTGVEEDKAVTFANMMVYYTMVEERAARDPIVMAKVERIRKVTKSFCPTLDDSFWDVVKGRALAKAGLATSD